MQYLRTHVKAGLATLWLLACVCCHTQRQPLQSYSMNYNVSLDTAGHYLNVQAAMCPTKDSDQEAFLRKMDLSE